MRRAVTLVPALVVAGVAAVVLSSVASAVGGRTITQAQAGGWDCNPLILIGDHYHCSPPGVPSVQDIIDGTATTPSIVHQVFHADGSFAGAETLIRADLFAGQPCPTDEWLPVPPWLPTPAYYACHHFQFTE
jgi:hypothetical protein